MTRSGRLSSRPQRVAPLEHPLKDLHISYGGAAREFNEGIDNFGALPSEKKKQIRKGLKTLCRESIMGLASAQRAMGDAGTAMAVTIRTEWAWCSVPTTC